jgi:hypothetical protein
MHIQVDSGEPKDRWRISYEDGDEPDQYTFRAFATIGTHLWPAIVAAGIGGNTYSRCVLASTAIAAFLKSRNYNAEVVKAVCDVSLRRDGRHVIPNTLGIGLPDPSLDLGGLHAVVRMADRRGGGWLIDGSTRQAARPGRWAEPPEVMITRIITVPPPMHPDDIYHQQGYAPLGAMGVDQGDGSVLLFQWVYKEGEPHTWGETPDGSAERAEKLSKRLNAAWARTKAPS